VCGSKASYCVLIKLFTLFKACIFLGENLDKSNSDSYKVEELKAEVSNEIWMSILGCRYLINEALNAVEQLMFVLVRIARDKKITGEDIDALARVRENIYINFRNVDSKLNDLIKTLNSLVGRWLQ